MLITVAPEMDGRSFATNVLEGVVLALSGRRSEDLRPDDYVQWLLRAGFRPRIETLVSHGAPRAEAVSASNRANGG